MTGTAHIGEQALDPGAIVIGGSAGSVFALLRLLERIPKGFVLPIVAVVHTPKNPPSGLVEALAHGCRLPVREPVDKEPLKAGRVFVAPPGYHLLVDQGPCFAFSVDAPENFSRPSVDVLFESALDVYGSTLIAVVLSGANGDGARGLGAIARAGGRAFVQSPDDASSPEMPRAAMAACATAEVLPAARIGDRLVDLVMAGRPG